MPDTESGGTLRSALSDYLTGHALRGYQERGCKPNTVKAYHRVLAAFFRWLVAEEQLADTPMRRVPKPKLPQKQVKPLTPEELVRLLEQPDRAGFTGTRDVAFIAFLADTGLRISEAIGAWLADVDPKHLTTVA